MKLSEYSTEVLEIELLRRRLARERRAAAKRPLPPCFGPNPRCRRCEYDQADGRLLARCPRCAAQHARRKSGRGFQRAIASTPSLHHSATP